VFARPNQNLLANSVREQFGISPDEAVGVRQDFQDFQDFVNLFLPIIL